MPDGDYIYYNDGEGHIRQVPKDKVSTFKKYFPKAFRASEEQLSEIERQRVEQSEREGRTQITVPRVQQIDTEVIQGEISLPESAPISEVAKDVMNVHRYDPNIAFRAKYGVYKEQPELFRDQQADISQTQLTKEAKTQLESIPKENIYIPGSPTIGQPGFTTTRTSKKRKEEEMESLQDFLTNTPQGRGFVELDAQRKKQLEEYDKQLVQQISELEKELEKAKLEEYEKTKETLPKIYSGVPRKKDVPVYVPSDDIRLAEENLYELKKQHAAVQDVKEGRGDINQFFREVGRRLPESIPSIVSGGLVDILGLIDRKQPGELTAKSERLLNEYASLHQADRSIAQDVAQGTVGSLEFMSQFASAGGAVGGITKGIGKKILKEGAKQAVKGAGKTVKIAGKEISEALLQTAIMPATLVNAVEKNAENPGSFLDAFANSYLSNLVEVGSERVGAFIPNFQMKFLPESVQKLRKATGIQGAGVEFLEEQIATAGHATLGDQQAQWSDLVDPRQQLITAGVVGIIQLPYASINTAGYAAAKYKNVKQKQSINKAYTQNLDNMKKIFGNEAEGVQRWIDGIIDESFQNEEKSYLFPAIVSNIANSEDFDEKQKDALIKYTLSSVAKNGMEKGKKEIIQQTQVEAQELARQVINPETNSIIMAKVPEMEQPVLIQGNVVLRDDGTVDTSKSGEVYYTDENGKRKVIDAKFIEIVENVPADQAMQEITTAKTAQTINSLANEEVRPYNPGETIRFTTDGTTNFVGQIQSVDQDGNYQVVVDGIPKPMMIEPRMIINEDNLTGVDNGVQVDYQDQNGNTVTGTVDDMSLRGNGVIIIDGKEVPSESVIGVHQETSKTTQETPKSEGIPTEQTQQNVRKEVETQAKSKITSEEEEAEKQRFMKSLPIIQTGQNKGRIDRSKMTPEQNIRFFEYQYGKDKAVEASRKMSENLKRQIEKEQKKLDNDPFDFEQAELVDQLKNQLKTYQDYAFSQMQAETEKRIKEEPKTSVVESREQRKTEIAKEEAGRTGEAGSAVKERWNSAEKIEGIEDVITLANGEKISGKYILTTAQALSPSHDIERNFSKTVGFPINELGNTVNDRDYEHDKTAQFIVEQRANNYDERAVQTPVVVSKDGVVISGNDRTMAGQLAAKKGTDKAYVDYITKYADRWGFTPEMVQSIQSPRIVFVPDADLPYNTETFAKFNAEEKKTQNTLERAIKSSKTISKDIVIPIANVIDQFKNLNDFYNDTKATQDVIKILTQNKVVQTNELPKLLDNDVFSVEGKSFLETIMLGAVLQEQALREIDHMRSARQTLMRVMPQLMRNASLKEYTIIRELNNAIHLLYEANKAGSKIKLYLSQTRIFDLSPQEIYKEVEKTLAFLLENAKDTELRTIFDSYNKEAVLIESGQQDMFEGVLSKADLLKLILNRYGQTVTTQQAGATPQRNGQGEGNRSGQTPGRQTEPTAGRAEQEIEAEAAKVDTNPTEAQKEAGNYKKGHVNVSGFDITIEQPKGSVRSGTDANGKRWSVVMNNHYGYIKRTQGKDGDQIDVFLGDNPDSRYVFVVDQVNPDGSFDEHKVMLGFDSIDEARKAYLSNYEEGWNGLGAITMVDLDDFRKWLDTPDRRIKPFAEYKQIQETTHETETTKIKSEVKSGFESQWEKLTTKIRSGINSNDYNIKPDGIEYTNYNGEKIFIPKKLAEQVYTIKNKIDSIVADLKTGQAINHTRYGEEDEVVISKVNKNAKGDISSLTVTSRSNPDFNYKIEPSDIVVKNGITIGDVNEAWRKIFLYPGTYDKYTLNTAEKILPLLEVEEIKPEAKQKEPWEMTKSEFMENPPEEIDIFLVEGKPSLKGRIGQSTGIFGDTTKGYRVGGTITPFDVAHRNIVKQALSEGKPVPKEVLKDYPELVKKYKANDDESVVEEAIQLQINWDEAVGAVPAKRNEGFAADIKTKEVQKKTGYDATIDNRLTAMERILTNQGTINFVGKPITGPAKITGANDVAFLFKNLENAASENVFFVLANDKGDYRVIYHSTGSTHSSSLDIKMIAPAVKEFGATKFWYVHNHPSGSLQPSDADLSIHKKIQEIGYALKIKVMPGIIINLDSGKYAEFETGKNYLHEYTDKEINIHERPKKPSSVEEKQVEIYSFDRSKLYIPSSEKSKIMSSRDVAEFLSKQKRGAVNKIHVIILDRGNGVNRYFLVDGNISNNELTKLILEEVGKHGESVILATNGSIIDYKKIKKALEPADIPILDILQIKQDEDILNNYISYGDEGLLREGKFLAEDDINSLKEEAKKYDNVDDFINSVFGRKPKYGMEHRPSYVNMPPAYNLLEGDTLPRDVYEHPEWSIASGRNLKTDKSAKESWEALQKIRNKPEEEITVYRAGREKKLNIGDWITFSKTYAQESLEKPEKVYSFKIKAKDAVFAGDDINEFGYYPKSKLIDIWNEVHNEKGSVNEESSVYETPLFRSIDEAGFYSTVEDALDKIKQEKGTAEQFKSMLLKNGAKQAEMDWMGWDDQFPDATKKISKSDIQDWIRKQQSIPVTDKMREVASQGMPLFSFSPVSEENDQRLINASTPKEKMSVVSDMVDEIEKKLRKSTQTVVLENQADVFNILRMLGANENEIREAENTPAILKGVYFNGVVLINADAARSAKDVLDTWVHENLHSWMSTKQDLLLPLANQIDNDFLNENLKGPYRKLNKQRKVEELIAYSAENLFSGRTINVPEVRQVITPILNQYLDYVTRGEFSKRRADRRRGRQPDEIPLSDNAGGREEGAGASQGGERAGIRQQGNADIPSGNEGVSDRVAPQFRSISDVAEEVGSKMPEDLRKEYDVKYDQFFTRFREAWVDTFIPVKEFLDLLRNNGVEIADYNDFYKQATHLQGKNDAQLNLFKDSYQHPITIAINELEKKGFSYRDIENYVFAKHGIERNEYMRNRDIRKWEEKNKKATSLEKSIFIDTLPKDYAGLTALEEEIGPAQEYIDGFEQKAGEDLTRNLWTAINNATHWTLNFQYKTGMISKDTLDHLTSMYQYYVPLRGHDKDTAEDRWDYTPDMGTFFTAPLIKAKGRRSRAESPFAYIEQMAHSAIVQGNKNTLKQTFLRLAQKDTKGLMSATKTWTVNIGTKEEPIWEQQFAPYDEDINRYLENQRIFEEKMRQLQKDGMAYQGKAKLDIGNLFIKPKQAAQHELQVYQNGVSHTVYINANPEIARSINGANRQDISRQMGFFSNVMRNMAANFTTRNPLFILTNFSRDYLYSTSMLLAKETPAYAWRFQRNLIPALGALQRYERGKVDLSKKADQYLYEYIMNGGKTGFSHIFELDRAAKALEREAKGGSKNFVYPARALIDVIDAFNEVAENVTRLSAYISSRQEGNALLDAINHAKNITINFNQKGAGRSVGKNAFEKFIFSMAGWVRPLYLFSNAAIQALNNIVGVSIKHPKKVAAIVASYSLAGFLVPLLTAAFGGDDGEDDYMKLSDWERQNNLCVRLPNGSFLKIPLPQELRVFYRLGDNIYHVMRGKKDMYQTFLDTLFAFSDLLPMSPMGVVDASWAELAPDFIRPFAQIYGTNTSFTGSKIYNEWANENMPGYLKARTNKKGEYYAPQFLVDWFRYLDHMTGGDSVKKGIISLNPDITNHLLRGYFGGLYTLAEQGIGFVSEVYNFTQTGDFEIKVRETPLRTFYVDKNDLRIESSGISSTYYRISDKVSEARRRDKGYYEKVKNGEMSLEEYSRKVQELNMGNVNYLNEKIKEVKRIERQMKEMTPEQQKDAEVRIFELKKQIVEESQL